MSSTEEGREEKKKEWEKTVKGKLRNCHIFTKVMEGSACKMQTFR